MERKIRLSKVLAAAGIASRRACETIIQERRVKVNGKETIVPQTLVDPEEDVIFVDGKRIKKAPAKVYFVLNKPLGYVCTNDARIKRKTVDLIPYEGRLFTIGRLDKDTTGLIIVTNDGHFAHKVMHPSGGIQKEYLVKVNKEVWHDDLVALSKPCCIDGDKVTPVSVKKVRNGTIKIVVQEGKNHEVRVLVEEAGLKVLELKRIRIGPLLLGKLAIGESKRMTPDDIQNAFFPQEY